MRDLIKRILREEVDKLSIEDKIRNSIEYKIRNYSGNDRYLKQLREKLVNKNEELSNNEILLAKGQFDFTPPKKETTISSVVYEDKVIQNLLMEKGKIVYNDLLNSKLSDLVNKIVNDELKIRIGKPNDNWFIINYNFLVNFNSDIKAWGQNEVWFEGTKMTIKAKIDELKTKLDNKDFNAILESETWSSLNKINTHYVFWADEITKRQKNKNLSGTNVEVIEQYFKKRKISELKNELPDNWINLINELKITYMSFADIDLIKKFIKESSKEFKNMKEKIQNTTNKGDESEDKFIELITNPVYNTLGKVKNVRKYATAGNIIDMVFGIDLSAIFFDGYKIIQVKSKESNAKTAFIKKLGIPYLSVFPTDLDKKEFGYFSEKNKDYSRNFNEDYLQNPKTIEPTLNYKDKEKINLEKSLGNPSVDYYPSK